MESCRKPTNWGKVFDISHWSFSFAMCTPQKIFFKKFAGIKKSVFLQRSQGLSLAVDSADSTKAWADGFHWPSVFLNTNVICSPSCINISWIRIPETRRSLMDFRMIRSDSPHFSMIIRSDWANPRRNILLKFDFGFGFVNPSCSYQTTSTIKSGHFP